MPSLAEAFVRVGLNTRGLSGALGRLKSMLTGTFRTITSGLMAGPLGMLMGGGPAAGPLFGGYKMIQAAANFEQVMANVSTMLQRPQQHMARFNAGIRDLSSEFGESTDTLAKGLYDVLSASVAPERALSVLRSSALAAKAGMTDTGVAADAITTLLNAYGMSADRAGEVSDTLFQTVMRGKTTFGQLAPAIGMVASTASSAGVSLDELGSVIALLTRNGVQTDNAITAINATIAAFLKPEKDAAKYAKELGFELSSTTLHAEGLNGVFRRIAALPPDAVARLFPNMRAIRGVIPALANIEQLGDDIAAMRGKAGATERAAAKMMDTFLHRWNQLRQAITAFARAIGGPLMKAIQPLVEGLSRAIPRITAAIDKFFADNMRRWQQWGEWIRQTWRNLWSDLAASGAGEMFVGFGKGLMRAIGKSLNIASLITSDWETGWEYIKAKFSEVAANLGNILGSALIAGAAEFMAAMKHFISVLRELFEEFATGIGAAFKAGIKGEDALAAYKRAIELKRARDLDARKVAALQKHPELMEEYHARLAPAKEELEFAIAKQRAAIEHEPDEADREWAAKQRIAAIEEVDRRQKYWSYMANKLGDEVRQRALDIEEGKTKITPGQTFASVYAAMRQAYHASPEARAAKERSAVALREMEIRRESRNRAERRAADAAKLWGPAAEMLKPENWIDWGQALGKRAAGLLEPAKQAAAEEKKKEPFGRGGFAGVTELGRQFQEAIFSAEQKRRERERTEAAKKTKTNTDVIAKQITDLAKKAATGIIAFSSLTP